ncbi:GTP-binding protein Rho1 [Serendipita sp. 411]|nr:GTP-binding protein Rho1 [Serendipita sp. 411]
MTYFFRHATKTIVIRRKLVVVGDTSCGKTSLFRRYVYREPYSSFYTPMVFESYVADIQVGNKEVHLAFWDTSAHEDYERLRPLSYLDAHAVLICFSFDLPNSLNNARDKWAPEILHFCSDPKASYILVGCKMDLKGNTRALELLGVKTDQKLITSEEAEAVARHIGAAMYLECSAMTGEGIDEVIEEAARVSLSAAKRATQKKSGCILL